MRVAEEEYLTVDQAATLLQTGRWKVYDLIHAGHLDSFCVGRHRRIRRSAIPDLVTRQSCPMVKRHVDGAGDAATSPARPSPRPPNGPTARDATRSRKHQPELMARLREQEENQRPRVEDWHRHHT